MGTQKEEVYMEAPSRFSDEFRGNEVCRIKKVLCGLKQSPRAWFERSTIIMELYGYR